MAGTKSRKSRPRRQAKKRLTTSQRKPRKKVTKTKPARIKPVKSLKPPKLPRPSKSASRNLRAQWIYLRRLGLIQSKRDARKIKANDKRVQRQIKQFADILRGKTKAIPVSKRAAKQYKKSGYKVKGQVVLVPQEKGTKVSKRGKLIQKRKKIEGGEIITILTPYSYADLQQGLDVIANGPEIRKFLRQGWRLALRYFGNYSYATMRTFEQLRDYLEHYNLETQDAEYGMVKNLELLIVLVKGKRLPRRTTKQHKAKVQIDRHKTRHNQRYFRDLKRRGGPTYERRKAKVKAAMRRYRKRKSRKGKR